MKIKEVEKAIGISSHTIRFYEEMGLMKIKRDPENHYREFCEEDVNRLKEIKVFRGLGIVMEEIRRYYEHEITLEQLMDHQIKELASQHMDMQLKEKLCEDIKKSKLPMIPYTTKQYDEILQYKQKVTPIEKAGSMISTWNKTEYSKKRIFFIECAMFPFVWIFVSAIVVLIFSAYEMIQTNTYIFEYRWYSILITTLISLYIAHQDYWFSTVLPKELYEFREHGIYYIKKGNRMHYHNLRKAIRKYPLEECMDFMPYDDLDIFKVRFHMFAKAPMGANAYQVDFYLFSKQDDVIQINTGMLGTSDEKVKLTAEILKTKAKIIKDPFKILEHLDDSPEQFYEYLDKIYWKRERNRVFGKGNTQ